MKIDKIIIGVLLVTGILLSFGGCIKDEFETPSISEIPLGHVMNIQQLRDFCLPGNTHKFTGDTSVVVVVTMDDKSGNLNKEAYAQDEKEGILVRLTSPGGLYKGDSIYINLKGTTLKYYRKVFQIDSVSVDDNIVKRNVGVNTEPEVVTISDIRTLDYESRLVKLENVQFVESDTSKTFADAPNLEYGELTIQDENGNSVMLRTSGYAKFASENVPNGRGSIVAIAGRYDDVVQLVIRKKEEVQFDGPRFTTTQHDGSFDDPYPVLYAIQNNTGNEKWVEGYLVGVMETSTDPFAPSFSSPFSTNSNVLLADSPSETNISNCLIVQLPYGDIRTAVNLKDKAVNLGKQIKLRGNLLAYFSSPGMKDTDGYWLDGNGINPGTQTDPFFEENFTSTLGSFTAHNVLGSQIWRWGTFDNGCAVISGLEGGSNYANEDWLVSPEVDLTSRVNVNLTIREAINFITSYDDMKVLVSSNFDGVSLPSESGDWTEFSGFSRPTGNSWNFSESGYIDISQYDGQKIHIGLRYTSSTTKSATWEVSKVKLTELTDK